DTGQSPALRNLRGKPGQQLATTCADVDHREALGSAEPGIDPAGELRDRSCPGRAGVGGGAEVAAGGAGAAVETVRTVERVRHRDPPGPPHTAIMPGTLDDVRYPLEDWNDFDDDAPAERPTRPARR